MAKCAIPLTRPPMGDLSRRWDGARKWGALHCRVARCLVGSDKTADRALEQSRQEDRKKRVALLRDARSQRSLVGFIAPVDVFKKRLSPESAIADYDVIGLRVDADERVEDLVLFVFDVEAEAGNFSRPFDGADFAGHYLLCNFNQIEERFAAVRHTFSRALPSPNFIISLRASRDAPSKDLRFGRGHAAWPRRRTPCTPIGVARRPRGLR
jgi:hypothetical protein